MLWIFGSQRTGSSWLREMLGDFAENRTWEEPNVGRLFGDFKATFAGSDLGGGFIFHDSKREVWEGSIRAFILHDATARYGSIDEGSMLVIKEPNGSVGASLISRALAESRFLLLIRDPRDAVASALGSNQRGGWLDKWAGREEAGIVSPADADPDGFVRAHAGIYLTDYQNALGAMRSHPGPKARVRYENLVSDAPRALTRLHKKLGLEVDWREAKSIAEKHSWANTDAPTGEGEFKRKGKVGSFREDLTPEQVRIVEEITAPLMQRFGYERIT